MSHEINSASIFVSSLGGVLEFVSPDGELLASIAVPPGRVPAREYLELLPDGAALEVSEGLAVVQPRSGLGVQRYGEGSHHSGANPDFRPTSASRNEREMRLTLARMQSATARLEARAAALASIEVIPTAPVVAPVSDAPVIE